MEMTLSELADFTGCTLKGDGKRVIRGVGTFESATADDITFANSIEYIKRINDTKAGAVIVKAETAVSTGNYLIAENPNLAFAQIVPLFHPPEPDSCLQPVDRSSSLHYIGRDAEIGDDVYWGPFVTIGDKVKIGSRVKIYPHTVIGDHAVIGDDTLIYANVTIGSRCIIGSRVIIHSGTVIGSDGFGFVPHERKYHKIHHIGIVRIDDDVEIGAGNTIDRATYGETWIKRGVKTDNLVHIAHNVTVGEDTILVAQVGLAGSVSIGNHAILAGQVGVTGHISIGDNVTVGPQSGVAKSIPNNQVVSGSPEMPHRLWLRVQHVIPLLPKMKKQISEMEKRIQELEQQKS